MTQATVEERLATLEAEVAELKAQLNGASKPRLQTGADLAREIGERFKDIPREVMEEAERLGREAMRRGMPDEE